MDVLTRRSNLDTRANPGQRLDYISELEGQVSQSGLAGPVQVAIRYVPDRLIVEPGSFGRYLGALGGVTWQSLEELGVTVLEDLNNETVARWVQVTVTGASELHSGIHGHTVLLEDRQPKWDNQALLSRLRRY